MIKTSSMSIQCLWLTKRKGFWSRHFIMNLWTTWTPWVPSSLNIITWNSSNLTNKFRKAFLSNGLFGVINSTSWLTTFMQEKNKLFVFYLNLSVIEVKVFCVQQTTYFNVSNTNQSFSGWSLSTVCQFFSFHRKIFAYYGRLECFVERLKVC